MRRAIQVGLEIEDRQGSEEPLDHRESRGSLVLMELRVTLG